MGLKANKKRTAVLGAYMSLVNLSVEQKEELKENLTYDNPAYVNAVRFSPYSRVAIDPELLYYQERGRKFLAPVGVNFNALGVEKVIDNRTLATLKDLPPFLLTLRETQRDAVQHFLHYNNSSRGQRQRGMIQMPTGKGKSIVGIFLARRLKQRTLVIVHKNDLLRGWQKDIDLSFGGKVKCGVVGGGKRAVGDFITVATVQTLNRLSNEEMDALKDHFGLVIVDEAHHCPSASYDLLNQFSARYKLGLTATPERKDGLTHLMFDYLGDFCYKYKAPVGEYDEDILPVHVYVRQPSTFFDPVCKMVKRGNRKTYIIESEKMITAGEKYELAEDEVRMSSLSRRDKPKSLQYAEMENYVIGSKKFTHMAIDDIKRGAESGKSCIVFFKQKSHCRMYYNKLVRAGVPEDKIQIYNGDCTKKELEECLVRAESREALITLTTYSKSTEGTNVKAWEVAFLVGSVNDGKNVEQAVGRVRRTAPNKADIATVFDYRLKNVPMFAHHFFTRVRRYQKLGFKISTIAQKQ